MDNVGQHDQHSPSLASEALLGMLLGMTACRRLPARPWPVVAACQTLANKLDTGSPLAVPAAAAASAFAGQEVVERWLQALAARGAARGEGRGLHACWVLDDRWLAEWAVVAEGLASTERAPWEQACQALATCRSTWSKAVAAAATASDPEGSGEPGSLRQPPS